MNRENLELLIKHLKTLKPESFYMGYFYKEDRCELPRAKPGVCKNLCGTAGCVIGHAPEVIEPLSEHISSIGSLKWTDYSEYVSGLGANSKEWGWFFGGYWTDCIDHACARIQWLLDGKEIPCRSTWAYIELEDLQ